METTSGVEAPVPFRYNVQVGDETHAYKPNRIHETNLNDVTAKTNVRATKASAIFKDGNYKIQRGAPASCGRSPWAQTLQRPFAH